MQKMQYKMPKIMVQNALNMVFNLILIFILLLYRIYIFTCIKMCLFKKINILIELKFYIKNF